MDPEDIIKWRNNKRKCSLFFDGASKGNPREERTRGVIYILNA